MRHSRTLRGHRSGRRWMRLFAALASLGGVAWLATIVIAETPLRDKPLQMAFAGIDGRIASRGAAWNWLGPIEYRSITLADRTGRVIAVVPRLVVERGLIGLAWGWLRGGPLDLGMVRLIGGEVLVEVRPGGSGLEDILAPWLAGAMQPGAASEGKSGSSGGIRCDVELINGAVELVDLGSDGSWRITDLLAAVSVRPDVDGLPLHGWTAAGRVQRGGRPSESVVIRDEPAHDDPPRFDRTTITAGATAALARDGGWSVSSPARAAAEMPMALAVAANRLPLGVTDVIASRLMASHRLDGLADMRLDISMPIAAHDRELEPNPRASAQPLEIVGSVMATTLAVCDAGTLEELVAIERCEVPLNLVVSGDLVTIRELRATSPLFKAEASGRLRIPQAGSWEWGEALVGENFALAADIDLAAAATAVPSGIAVRPDVKVTGGQLQLTAAARPDGKDRVLEVRATSRDLAAVQHTVDGERPLRWNDPFTAWLRGRRGPARSDRLQIEEARIASPAVELAATGTAESSTVQWTIDIDTLVEEASEVLDLGAVSVHGAARGTLEWTRTAGTGGSTARLSASFTDFSFASPGRRQWSDTEIAITAEGAGAAAGPAWLVDRAHATITASGDTFEATLAGGAIVAPQALLRRLTGAGSADGLPWIRTAPEAEGLSVECSLVGDLARWQQRIEPLVGGATAIDLGGNLQASGAVAARGQAWQITRANLEIEKLVAAPVAGSWRIEEPRLVASAAGLVNPPAGTVEISSAELLTATLSLRTGGAMLAARPEPVDRVRGKVQWQADVGRLEKWFVPAATAARWPATGRAWGTAEVLDTPEGVNLLVEVTGDQLAVARGSGSTALAGGAAPPQPVWGEPRAAFVLEVTRPRGGLGAADQLTVNRLVVESSTLAVAATGSVNDLTSRKIVDLGGTISYDWSQMSRLLTPWTGGSVQLVGGGPRPFAVRAPLGDGSQPAARSVTAREPAMVPLPESWLEGNSGDAKQSGTITLPVATAPPRTVDPLRDVSIETSTTWTAADLGGLRIDPGEMGVRLFEGQLAFGPFDIGAAGGRLRGAPWIKLFPLPGELVIPPGRLVERVALSRELCDRWVSWLVPILGRSTHTDGLISIDLAGGRIPFDDPFGGDMSGQILFERLEVTPSGNLQPLVNLIVKLQSVIDPRFAFGDKAVLLRVRPEPVRVRLAERRMWHEGLVMDSGSLSIHTKGSVGADGSLAMVAELAFRGEVAGQTPVIAQLLRTPLVIPLRGTVSHPQFDASQIDTILGRIVENTAEAVINDGLSRGLEAIFGK
ncbi:MAG: hypothetical protein ACKOYJ_04100 [Planctomycetia bacterium]